MADGGLTGGTVDHDHIGTWSEPAPYGCEVYIPLTGRAHHG